MKDRLARLDLSSAFGEGAAPPRLEAGAGRLDPRLPPELFRPRAPRAPPPPAEPPVDPELPAAGSIVDKLRLEALVGMGGFAAVFRATHLLLGRTVAVKLLRPAVLRRRPELAPMLCQEARLAARIDHPCVVRVLDVTQGPRLTYLVLEYLDGGSLAEAIARTGRLPLERVVPLAVDVVDGLAAGLEQGVIHRDVKPANILLTATGRAKVADLGLAGPGEGHRGSGAGTPGYMAPEQADGRALDFRADVFALGVTLAQALTGALPSPPEQPGRPWPALAALAPPVRALLERMLGPLPGPRAASYRTLRAELLALG